MSNGTRTATHAARATDALLIVDENRLACTALERLATRSAPDGRLAFLHGPSGTGKSLLVRHFLKSLPESKWPSATRLHVTAREFSARQAAAKHVADAAASRGGKQDPLTPNPSPPQTGARGEIVRLSKAEAVEPTVFVCEDLGGLDRRREVQIRFVSVLDDVLAHGGLVVVTADGAPGDVADLLPRIVSRLRGGVTAAIPLPGPASRRKLLEHFAATRQIPLPADATQLLADELELSPRELAATLVNLDAAARLRRRRVDREFVRSWLANEEKGSTPRLDQIARAVARHFEIPVTEIRSADRQQSHVLPRQCAMYLARELTDESLSRIADFFGRKNHSTVVHACRRVADLAVEQATLRSHLTRLRKAVTTKDR